jgi:hypothetical protein
VGVQFRSGVVGVSNGVGHSSFLASPALSWAATPKYRQALLMFPLSVLENPLLAMNLSLVVGQLYLLGHQLDR